MGAVRPSPRAPHPHVLPVGTAGQPAPTPFPCWMHPRSVRDAAHVTRRTDEHRLPLLPITIKGREGARPSRRPPSAARTSDERPLIPKLGEQFRVLRWVAPEPPPSRPRARAKQ